MTPLFFHHFYNSVCISNAGGRGEEVIDKGFDLGEGFGGWFRDDACYWIVKADATSCGGLLWGKRVSVKGNEKIKRH